MMRRNLAHIACATTVSVLVATVLSGQGRPADGRGFYETFRKGGLHSEAVGGSPTQIILGTAKGEVGVAAPFEVPSDAQHVEIGEGHFYLVSGTSEHGTPAQRGVISWLQLGLGDPPTISVVASRDYLGMDPYRIAWDQQQGLLYMLDGTDNQIRMAPWSGPAQPFPVASAFAVAFGPGAVPTLAADPVSIWCIDGGLRIADIYIEGFDAVRDGGTWGFRPYSARTREVSPRWYAPGHRQLPAVGSFDLKALAVTGPQPWILVPVLDSVTDPLLTGIHPGDGSYTAITCPPEFYDLPGRPYRIEGGDLRSQRLTPVVTYGAGVGTPQLMVDQDIRISAEFLYVGVEKFFGITTRVKRTAASASASTLDGFLLVDIREDASGDPVVPAAGGGVTLADPAVIAFPIQLPGETDPFMVRWSFDVSDDAALENVVLLFQLVVVDDLGQAAYTGVNGGSILPASANPANQGPAARAGFQGSSTGYRDWCARRAAAARGGEALRRARELLGQDPETGDASTESRQIVRRLRRAMRR